MLHDERVARRARTSSRPPRWRTPAAPRRAARDRAPGAEKPRTRRDSRRPCARRRPSPRATRRSKFASPACSTTITTSAPYLPSSRRQRRDARRAREQRVHFAAATRIGQRARRGHRLERHLRSAPPRDSANANMFAITSTFASVCSSRTSSGTAADALADDAPGRRAPAAAPSSRSMTRSSPSCAGFDLERLLLRRHDALERRVARARHAFVDRHHGRQRELHDLRRALELAARRAASVRDVERRHRRRRTGARAARPSSVPTTSRSRNRTPACRRE